MKFDMTMRADDPLPSGTVAVGAIGTFDVDPDAVAAVLLDVDAETAGYSPAASAMVQNLAMLAEESKSVVIAEKLAVFGDDIVHRGLADITGRTGNALTAVAEVLGILSAADTEMSDTARHSAARAAQRAADDDPYAQGDSEQAHRNRSEPVR